MSHAAITHTIFERLEMAQERCARAQKEVDSLASQAELVMLLNEVFSVMRDIDTRNFSDGKRTRFNAVKSRVDLARLVA